MQRRISTAEIGGGVVRRHFTFGADRLKPGDELSAEQVQGIPYANREALRSKGFLDVVTVRDTELSAPTSRAVEGDGEFVLIGLGKGKFNVLFGHQVNAEPLTKVEADKFVAEQEELRGIAAVAAAEIPDPTLN
jgi:hypothetical protein